MSKGLEHPNGFEIKTADRFACGLMDVNWEKKEIILSGIGGGRNDEMDPHDVWLGLRNGSPDGSERIAVVVLDRDGQSFQLAHYDLKQFEKECYGPV